MVPGSYPDVVRSPDINVPARSSLVPLMRQHSRLASAMVRTCADEVTASRHDGVNTPPLCFEHQG
ncbi:hypothetical protein [Methanoregula sp.]|uniref:hypothetical protein n=1 Tax=Methanoregula sp. TaxID=2052170 RepID=UPI000CB77251|nr:hypothetical protein [Methanoregula sp.]PKG31693.1 MAG: hypothetical protein CW742_12065 [Methanoregula sp.]